MIYKFSSIKEIINKVYRDSGSPREFPFEDCIEWCGEALDKIGAKYQYVQKITGDLENPDLIIENYKAELPCGFKSLEAISINGMPAFYSGNTFYKIGDGKCTTNPPLMPKPSQTTYKDGGGRTITIDNTLELPYVYSTKRYEFNVNDNYIFTNVKEGTICLSYNAIPTDSDGYPLIPDNSSFTRALEFYIKKYYFTILFDMGKIAPAVLQNVQQEYAWAVGDCQSEFNRLSIDKAESFYNSWSTLVARATAHDTGFRYNGTQEKIRVH